MILDIILLAILIIFAFIGYKKGFASAILEMTSSILSILGAYYMTPSIREYVRSGTKIYDNLIPKANYATYLPSNFTNKITASISNLIFSILIFLALFIFIKICLKILAITFKSDNKDNALSGTNKLIGLLFGFAKGFIVISILAMVMLPLSDTFFPSLALDIKAQLNTSILGHILYENNPILMLFSNAFKSHF